MDWKSPNFWLLIAVVALIAVQSYNALAIAGLSSLAALPAQPSAAIGVQGTQASASALSGVAPTGVPAIYGSELGVSFDDVSASNPALANQTIQKLGNLDNTITLSGEAKNRYIGIASRISCEYCCGADSLIFANGQRACGCAHSYSMRGLAKYLLKNHPNDFTDDQVLEELGKWKTLFFPGILAQKAQVLKEKGIEFNYINLASNKYRGIETGAPQGGSQMAGGC